MNDLLLKNAVIYDGSGGPWYRGDVAIREGIINEIGTLTPGCASETIDLEGRVLCPGFVDVHSHSDFSAFLVNDVDGKITQGVTTEVVSNCGLAMTPSVPERAGLLQEYMRPYLPEGVSLHNECSSLEEMMDRTDSSGYVTDLAFHVAHGPLRIAALGFENRKATPGELELMKDLLAREMESGAVGLSSGLIYPPGCFADTDELVELCRVAAAYGGIYATHMRSESGNTLNAVAEAINIGRRSGCAVHISHHKIMEQLEGLSEKTLGMMETAQKEGIDVTCDVYPYTAGSTMIGALLPPWVNEGGAARLVARVADPTCRKRIAEDMKKEIPGWDNFSRASGLANILIFTAEKDKTLEGRTIGASAADRGQDPLDALFDIIVSEQANCTVAIFSQSESDNRRIIAHPLSMIGSDSHPASTKGIYASRRSHPRAFGTFPRVLGKYVREDHVIPLETAIWKMTGFPARRFGLSDRGLIKKGLIADLVAFDPQTIRDCADFTDTNAPSKGIACVWKRGKIIVRNNVSVAQPSGKCIRRKNSC